MSKAIRGALAALLVSIALLSCGAPPKAAPTRTLTVASKIDTEGSILGSMLLIRLSEAGIPVRDRLGFGPTDLVRKAIIAGEIDIYPEYTGNGAFFFPGTDPETWKDRNRALQTVRSLDKERNGLEWLESANANNTWAIAIRGDLARGGSLRSLSELGAYIARGGDFKLAGSEEFVTRPDALPAFEAAYGFKLRKDQLVVLSGGNTATTEQAAARGTDGVNAAMAYGTDGQLAALGLVVLSDDKGVQPVYEPAPLVRADALAAYPNLGELLSPVFAALDLVTLQSLNAAVAVEGQDARTVALEWMRAKGLAK